MNEIELSTMNEEEESDIETVSIDHAVRLLGMRRLRSVKSEFPDVTLEGAIRGIEAELEKLPAEKHRSYLVDSFDMQGALLSLDINSSVSDILYAAFMVELVHKNYKITKNGS